MGDKLGYFRVTLPRSRMNTAKESAFYQLFPTQRRKRHASVHTANCMPYFPFSSKELQPAASLRHHSCSASFSCDSLG